MSFLKKILSAPTGGTPSFYSFTVKCNRCGEVIEGRINLNNDLSVEYGAEGSGGNVYYVRKVLVGNGKCFQQIEVELKFDESRRPLEKHATGGQFIE
jgi:hypothetical protein